MTELIPADAAHYDNLTKVVELHIQGTDPTRISRALGIKRKDVLDYIEEFRQGAIAQGVMKDRVAELLSVLDQHYSMLVQKGWKTLNEIDDEISANGVTHQMLGQRTSALKVIAELEQKRIDVLQKAGLLDAADLGDEIAEMEEQRDAIISILQNDLCHVCKPNVLSKLANLTGHVAPVEVVNA